MKYPTMYRTRQNIKASKIDNIEDALFEELASISFQSLLKPEARIAITAGSRGIKNIDHIFKHLVHILKEYSTKPFLIPSMGSHGGGTAEGQLEILKKLNITEDSIGAPIVSTMDAIEIGKSSFGFPIMVDRQAAEADGIIVVNRVKPHTEFGGSIESGLMKMMAIGMGKRIGCLEVHKQSVAFGYQNIIPEVGSIILKKLHILFGVAIVENFYDETAIIRAVKPSQFEAEEKKLLFRAKTMMARLPFKEIHVLIVDEMGKNISGAGMDTNVIGRIKFIGERETEYPKIIRIVVLDLTEESQGNALGIGLADYTTQRLVNKIDPVSTSINSIAAMTPEKGRIPICLKSERGAIEAALSTVGPVSPDKARVVHIKNTLEIAEFDISEALLEKAREKENIILKDKKGTLAFDSAGKLERITF